MKSVGLLMIVGLALVLSGCGTGNAKIGTPTPAISMAIAPASAGIDQGQAINLTATVLNDSANRGATWTVSGAGTLSNVTLTSATYNAPATVAANTPVTITATSAADTSKTAAVTVTVAPPPAVTTPAAASTNITVGSTYTLALQHTGGTAPFTWAVTVGALPAGVTLNSATGVISGTPTALGTMPFTVQVTDSGSPRLNATSALSISVNPAPPVVTTHPSSHTVIVGQTASFSVATTGTAPLSYQWFKNGTPVAGATSSSYTTPASVIGDNGALFTVSVINTAATVTSNAATLTVNAPPAITAQPANQTMSEGQTATFSVTASGTSPLSYQWQKNGTAIPGATSSSYTTPATVLADNSAGFGVVITNVAGSVTSTPATLTVNPVPPAITAQPANQTVSEGQTASFSVTATGSAPLSYQWRKYGVDVIGATSSSYTTPASARTDNGAPFTVTVSNAAGNVTSSAASLTVNAVPPSITTQPANQTVTAGQTASFSVAATGTGPLSYQWKKDGTAIVGATSNPYTTPATIATDNGALFTVVVTNPFGSPTSSTAATLTVNTPPSITAQPAGQNVTDGQTTTFSVTATGTAPLSYQWKKNGTAVVGATSTSYTTPASAMTDNGAQFTVVVTNVAASVTSNVATLTVNAVPPAITGQPANQTVTAGQTASFSVTATGTAPLTYQWHKNSVDIAGATSSTYTTPATLIGDDAALFSVTVSNAGGNLASSTATLTVNPVPVAPSITTQPEAQTVLAGQTATFSVTATGTPTLSYQWHKNTVDIVGATSSSYTTPATGMTDRGASFTVTVTNTTGTVTSNNAVLTVNAVAPAITVQPGNQTVSEMQTATFSVTATGTAPLFYNWLKDGIYIPGATASSYTTPPTAIGDNGAQFTVTVSSNTHATLLSSAATLTVNAVAPAITGQPGDQSVTVGQTATFNVTATGTAPLTYQWHRNGVDLPGATASSYTAAATALADNGVQFSVTVTNSAGNITSNLATLTVASTYQVSGNVMSIMGGSSGLSGITITLNTSPVQTTTTDSSGAYNFSNLPNGSYVLTPSITGASSVFLPTSLNVTVSGADLTDQNFQGEVAYNVSGTVNYAGARTGRVYLELNGTGNYCTTPGTSVSSSGSSFTIRGVCPGTYTLNAWMDNLGFGKRNSSNPLGSVAVTVSNSNVLGQTVTLNDPAAVDISAKTTGLQIVAPTGSDIGHNGVVVMIQPVKDTFGQETATSYRIEWSVDPSFGSGVSNHTFPATGGNEDPHILSTANGLTGLTMGAPYFRVRAANLTSQTAWATYPSPVTIASPTGLNTVSGAITFSGWGGGPLYAGCYDQNSGAIYSQIIVDPASPQAYSIPGVPLGANCFMFAIVDQNRNGLIDSGDISNTENGVESSVVVPWPGITHNITLPSANAFASVNTIHTSSSGVPDWYSLNFTVRGNIKVPVALAMTAGPNVLVPVDVAKRGGSQEFSFWPTLGPILPNVGDAYDLNVTYLDGTSEILQPAVATVLDAFARNLSAIGGTTPSFTWLAPATPPASYTYRFWISDNNGNTVWQVPGQNADSNGLSSLVTSLAWGVDPTNGGNTPSVGSLTSGVTYSWSVTVIDSNGNSATRQVTHTP